MNNRIFYSDNGALTDWSINLNRYKTGTYTFSYVASEDAIYIGSRHPFNHFYLKVGSTVNAVSTSMSIKYWDSNKWINAVEIIDETDALTQSGFVSFVPNKDYVWSSESTNDNGETIDGLSSVVVYDLYWIKITFANDLTTDLELSWLGQIFCEDYDLAAEFPDLDRQTIRDSFGSGKTDWEEQRVTASEIIVQDLIKKKIIWDKGQILNREIFKLACVQKLAEIIYTALGDDYLDQKKNARNEYNSRMNLNIFKIDLNQDGLINEREEKNRMGFLSR